jgi:hypothetical protein
MHVHTFAPKNIHGYGFGLGTQITQKSHKIQEKPKKKPNGFNGFFLAQMYEYMNINPKQQKQKQ